MSTKPKSHARLSRIMLELCPGDVLTNLNCPTHRHHQVLVLGRRGVWIDLSIKAMPGHLSIVLDENGPWRWDDQAEALINKEGRYYGHIAPGIEVQKHVALRQLGWFRELPPANADRWHISPQNLPGSVVEPSVAAKVEALLGRLGAAAENEHDSVRTISQIIELIFAGSDALDERRMRLLIILVNGIRQLTMSEARKCFTDEQRSRQSQRDPREELEAGLVGMMMSAMMSGQGRDLNESDFGEALFGGMGLERRPRRERREPHEGNRSTERTPHHRGNGADHSAHEHHGFPG